MGTRVRRPMNRKPTPVEKHAPVVKVESVQPKFEAVQELEEQKSPRERMRRGRRIEETTESND